MASSDWAKKQLAQLLPLDDDSLQQLLDYTSGLSAEAAAAHLRDILGDSARALEFISSFNARRNVPQGPSAGVGASSASTQFVPRATNTKGRKKGKPPLNQLPPPRQIENQGDISGAYQKKAEDDYFVGRSREPNRDEKLADTLALSDKPIAQQSPKKTQQQSLKPPPSASGPLISDLPNVHSKSPRTSRNASPAPKTTVSVTGGASMHGASTTLQDLVSHLVGFHSKYTSLMSIGFRNPAARNADESISIIQ